MTRRAWLDLYASAFSRLGPLTRGSLDVTIDLVTR